MIKRVYLLFMLAAAGLAACGDNGNTSGGGGNTPEPPAKVTANVTYEAKGGKDMLKLFDITAQYVNAAGETVSEKVTTLPWAKSVSGVNVPFAASVELKLTAITEYPDQTSYTCGINQGISYSTSDGRSYIWSNTGTLVVPKDQVAEYQELVLGRDHKSTTTIE